MLSVGYRPLVVRCHVTVAVSMGTFFWDVALCSLIDVYRLFRCACCLIALKMVPESCSETSVNFYKTTWRNITEDSHLHRVISLIILRIRC
jgi:hypothetical protein